MQRAKATNADWANNNGGLKKQMLLQNQSGSTTAILNAVQTTTGGKQVTGNNQVLTGTASQGRIGHTAGCRVATIGTAQFQGRIAHGSLNQADGCTPTGNGATTRRIGDGQPTAIHTQRPMVNKSFSTSDVSQRGHGHQSQRTLCKNIRTTNSAEQF